jgi:hypothetical protein
MAGCCHSFCCWFLDLFTIGGGAPVTSILPIKVLGNQATFVAELDDGEFYVETYTLESVDKSSLAEVQKEFELLLSLKGSALEKPEDPAPGSEFFDPVTGKPVDESVAREQYAKLAPREESPREEG